MANPRTCRHCGVKLSRDARASRHFCGRQCANSYSTIRSCVDCGTEISCRAVGRPRQRCTRCVRRKAWRSACVKLRSNHRKRCRLYNVPFDPRVKAELVFRRDKYVCHICKRRTLRAFAFDCGAPNPLSPTIDHHPYPLCLGIRGHEWDNVKCACWLCNVRKSRSWDGQNLLFK